jgi:hypothetical protein
VEVSVTSSSDVTRNVFVRVMVVGEGLFPKRRGIVITSVLVILVETVEVVT